jgi:gliding motility-associated transport system ATP-binding protein
MIKATQLTKDYGELRALDQVSFEIERGECIGLLGLNGAGKTTLLRILSCLLAPSSGQISVEGRQVTESSEFVRRQIGYLPEDPPLYGEMKVAKFLDFVARLRRVPSTEIGGRVQDVTKRCQLSEVVNQPIETLSYGYKKRVGIAQAIVHNPPLVILDEPIAGLDPAQIVEMRELVRGLSGQHTVVQSSHILTEISQTCDRILVMQRGKIVASGTEQELTESLQKEKRLTVQVLGKIEDIEKTLKTVSGVVSWKVVGDPQPEIELEIETSTDLRAELSRALVKAGIDLLQLSAVQDRLEATFLRLTGDQTEDKS